MDFHNHKVVIFGIQGSGKTVLAKHIMRGFKKPMVYKINQDFNNEQCYLYKPTDVYGELDSFIKWFNKSDHDLLILDEADLFFSSNFSLAKYPNLNDLAINHRHYNKTLVLISRRPQDIPTKIVESCKVQFWFKIEGANVQRKLQEIDPRMLELMEQLKFGDFQFIVKEIGQAPSIHAPVKN